MVIDKAQSDPASSQEQDPVINTGETLDNDIPEVYSNSDQRQQPTHQEDSGFKEPSQGEYKQSLLAQQDHLGSNPRVKIIPGITLTDEVHHKKFRGQPPKVKLKNMQRQPCRQGYTLEKCSGE